MMLGRLAESDRGPMIAWRTGSRSRKPWINSMVASRTLARWNCYAPDERGGFGTLCDRVALRQRRSIGRLSASVFHKSKLARLHRVAYLSRK